MTKPLGQLSQTEKSEKPEKRETYWTSTEKESLKETYGTEILVENGSPADVMTREAPTDASIVTYTVDGKEHQDLTRGSRVKLFDMYYDKFTNVKRIDYGQGTIKPSLWDTVVKQHPKRKSESNFKNRGKKIPPKIDLLRFFLHDIN